MIAAGDAEIVVAGGMESMTKAPYLLPGARGRLPPRRRHARRLDDVRRAHLRLRPLRDGPGHRALQPADATSPASARTPSPRPPTSGRRPRPRTAGSPRRSSPVEVPQRKGDPIVVDTDEGVRPGTTPESLGRAAPGLRPRTAPSRPATPRRSPTAAQRSSSPRPPRRPSSGSRPLGEFVGYGQVAGPDTSLLLQPANAITKAAMPGRRRCRRHRPLRDQRGLRGGRPRLGRRARDRRGQAERQRRRDRPRPPGRDVGHPPRADRPARAAPPRWRGWPPSALCGGGGQGDAPDLPFAAFEPGEGRGSQ